MEATTVPQTTDKTHIEDWRTGVVELPADHVYGATALDDLSWQLLNEKRHGTFLVDEWTVHTREQVPAQYREHRDRLSALDDVRHRVELNPGAFHPERGPYRIVVTEVFR